MCQEAEIDLHTGLKLTLRAAWPCGPVTGRGGSWQKAGADRHSGRKPTLRAAWPSDEASRKQAQTDSGRKPLLRAAQPHGQVRDGGLSWPWAGALSEHMDTVGANRHRGRSCLAHGRR